MNSIYIHDVKCVDVGKFVNLGTGSWYRKIRITTNDDNTVEIDMFADDCNKLNIKEQ